LREVNVTIFSATDWKKESPLIKEIKRASHVEINLE
jgi:hypothetical protein